MRRPTLARSRALALLILLVLVGVVAAAAAIPAVLLHRHYDALIADSQDRIERFRRVGAQQSEWKRAGEELRSRDSSRFLLKNHAANLAGAELQDMVRNAIEANAGKIVTIQSAQPREEGGFRQVGLNVQMFANTAATQRILHALESQVPYVFIDNVSIRATAFRGYRPNPGVDPELSVQMDVFSYSRASAPAAAPAPAQTGASAGSPGQGGLAAQAQVLVSPGSQPGAPASSSQSSTQSAGPAAPPAGAGAQPTGPPAPAAAAPAMPGAQPPPGGQAIAPAQPQPPRAPGTGASAPAPSIRSALPSRAQPAPPGAVPSEPRSGVPAGADPDAGEKR